MKSLTLLRHAKSEPDSPGGDFERSLNERGRADSARMGREMRDIGLGFDLVLASPARRVAETIELAGGLSPRFDERLYDATTDQILAIVRATDDSVGRLLLVGHNPGFERLAARLTTDAIADFPTAALVEIALPVDHWREVEAGGGRMTRFVSPKELA